MRILIAVIFLSVATSVSQAALTDDLVAYYGLNETSGTTASEGIGGNHGTLSGNFTGSEWTAGQVGGGLQFTRSGQDGPFPGTHAGFIEADSLLSSGVLNDADSYTFSAWVKWAPQAGGGANWGYTIWGANTAVGTNGNVMRVGIYDNAIGTFAHGTGSSIGTFDFTDEEWHLYTIAFGPDGNADYYLDGVLNVSKAADTGKEREKLFSTATLFHFGMEMEGNKTTDAFSGTMDELAIWNRELSAQEISDLYNNGAGVNLGAVDAVVPEPASIVIALIGILAGASVLRWRRKRS